MTRKKQQETHKDNATSHSFEEAVSSVLNAPPLPEQQAKKEAAKARREERKRQQEQQEQTGE